MTRNILSMMAVALLASCGGGPTPEQKALAEKEATNKAAYEKLMKAFSTNDKAAMSEVLADNFMSHNPDPMVKSTGKQAWLDACDMYMAASPDMKGEMKVMIVDGDWVGGTAMVKGTNTGSMGPGMPATNKPWEATSMEMIRFENGKAVEHWGLFDSMKMMMDLGMMGGDHDMAMEKEHVCNPGCKGDAHNILHGEKGHVCAPDCPGMKEMEGMKAEEKKG